MKITLDEQEVKFALAVEVFRKTGMRVEPEDIKLKVVVSNPEPNPQEVRHLDYAILELRK